MKDIYLFGAGVGSREILRIIGAINDINPTWNVLGFVDKDSSLHGHYIDGYPVIPYDKLVAQDNVYAACAIFNPKVRKQVVENEIEVLGYKLATIIHPSVFLPNDVSIESGVMIYPGTQISFGVALGKACLIFFNTLLGHDLKCESYVTICPGATINGTIKLNKGAFIGAGVVIHQGISVGEWSNIGIGSIVVQNVKDNNRLISLPRQIVSAES